MGLDYWDAMIEGTRKRREAKPKPRAAKERHIQEALVEIARLHIGRHPSLRWFHSTPNEHWFPPKQNPNTGAWFSPGGQILNRLGRVAGVWDLHLPAPRGTFCGMWLETKAPGGRLTKEQEQFGKDMVIEGHYCVIYDDWEIGWRRLLDYLEYRTPAMDSVDDARTKGLRSGP